jgi:acetate kinase
VVVAHLGSGASMCAIDNGRSVGSSMGFTALDGLLMGTRPGNMDPGIVLYLLQQEGLSAKQIEDLLYKRSGLLGLSGIGNDMRVLLASEAPRARLAIDHFVYRISRELGALAAVLGGLDALVFTAGIGENSARIRATGLRAGGMAGDRSRYCGQ